MELIDKQAAIKALNSMPTYYDEYEDAIMIKRWSAFWSIEQLPPVTQKQQWVPCSERLPKVKQKVLVQYADGSMATKRCNDAGHLQWFYANAVAWMPAPEPWKGDAE